MSVLIEFLFFRLLSLTGWAQSNNIFKSNYLVTLCVGRRNGRFAEQWTKATVIVVVVVVSWTFYSLLLLTFYCCCSWRSSECGTLYCETFVADSSVRHCCLYYGHNRQRKKWQQSGKSEQNKGLGIEIGIRVNKSAATCFGLCCLISNSLYSSSGWRLGCGKSFCPSSDECRPIVL